jgi:hypothetical protein
MLVTFTRDDKGRTCGWFAHRPGRVPVPGPAMAAGDDLPHDLATLVAEAVLGLSDGFWGCVQRGATFRSLRRRPTRQGRKVIRDHVAALDAAETAVNLHYWSWRAGRPTPVGEHFDAILRHWRTVGNGASLTVAWPTLRIVDTAGRADLRHGSSPALRKAGPGMPQGRKTTTASG